MWKFSEKRPFFQADMAGLGKCSVGRYGRIGVHRVNIPYEYCKCRNFCAVHIFAHFGRAVDARKYDVSEKKCIIVEIEFTARCAKICLRKNTSKDKVRENIGA